MPAGSRTRWSQRVTQSSNALDLEPGVFALDDPRRIARSLKRSADRSRRRKSGAFRSAMSMLTFYINRAGKSLSPERRARLDAAKEELRALYHRARRTSETRLRRLSVVVPLIIVVIGLAACSASRPPTCGVQSPMVESAIATVAHDWHGHEYCQFRRYETLSDIDGDGVDDFVVLFTVEDLQSDGNDHADFMSVFLSSRGWQPMTVRTGRRGEQDPVGVDVRDGKLYLDALVYLPDDATCCPSGRTTLVYEVRGNALVAASEHQPPAEPEPPAQP